MPRRFLPSSSRIIFAAALPWCVGILVIGLLLVASLRAQPAARPAVAATTAPATRPTRPIPEIERVVIISVDGLRPDLLIRTKTPHIHSLIESGSASFWAQTTDVAITLPSHTSMLTGVPPETHKITWNDDSGNAQSLTVPTVFELAKNAGYTTAMVAGKSKFLVLAKPGTLDWVWLPFAGTGSSDRRVAEKAAAIIGAHRPDLLMVHLPSNDAIGHMDGWGSPEQIAGLEKTDDAIGLILTALDDAKVRAQTLIILTADHGGAGLNHGGTDPRSRHIPWIASGPGIRPGYDLNLDPEMEIHTEDTCATAWYVLGITPTHPITGRPVLGIFSPRARKAPATPGPN